MRALHKLGQLSLFALFCAISTLAQGSAYDDVTLMQSDALIRQIAPPVYAALGRYVVTVSGPGLIGYSSQIWLPCRVSVSCATKGVNLVKNLASVRYVDPSNSTGWSGADACAWITSAQNDLPSQGGQIVLIDGSYSSCAGGFTIGSANKPVTLRMGTTTLTVNAQVAVNFSNSHIIGVTGSAGSASNFAQGRSFPASTPVIALGPTLSGLENTTVEGVGINCNGVANSIGGEDVGAQEQSGFFYVTVQNCTKYGLWYEGINAQNSSGRGWVIAMAGGGAGTIGGYIHNVPSFRGVKDATFTTNDASTIGNQLVIDGSSGFYSDIHIEHGTNGIDIGPLNQSAGVLVENLTGGSSVPTLIKVENVSSNRVTLVNIIQNGSATTLNDAFRRITDTNTLIEFYDSNDANLAPFYIVGGQGLKVNSGTPMTSTGAGGTMASQGADINASNEVSSAHLGGAVAPGSALRWKITDQGRCTMSAGTCSAQSLGSTYSSAPVCFLTWTGTGTLTGILKVASTTTTVTPASTVGTDTAQVNWECHGN